MTFISYAQNFEDVLLWRALRHVSGGFYIDVGASHPDVDSTTRAFYERGWRGINIEPGAADAARLAAARPDDITLQLAAGRADGETELFNVPGTGLSTTDPAVAAGYGGPHWRQRCIPVARRTLAGLCRAHVRGPIHFLKIDVEGAEADVLAGADFMAYRPWILLVEATAPLSTRPTQGEWEAGLIAQGYRFVWFDGLNRFYLSDERFDELRLHFQTPPNVFDDFIRASDTSLAGRIASAESRAESLAGLLDAHEKHAAEAAARARAWRERSQHEIAQLQQALGDERRRAGASESCLAAALHEALHEVQQAHLRLQAALREGHECSQALGRSADKLRETEAWLDAVRRSSSWRLTAPVRVALRRLGRGGTLPARIAAAPVAEVQALPPAPAPAPAPVFVPAAGFFDVPSRPPAHLRPGRERHSVHQFHSGSAVADAITNAMLLTRTILRGLGYASEIFVTHLDPQLAGELLPIDALPQHDDYVLIVRHSMGHDAFDRILALPAPKILIYHNITPPELFAREPSLAAYSVLGRLQLAALAGHVHAALADSEFNAIELRQLGFEPVRSCTLLFDIAQIRARARASADAGTARRDGVFTILFVGRICQSKAQIELVEAYVAFRDLNQGPARLVLVGRDGGDADPYLHALQECIAASPYADEIRLVGLVSDAERDDWYSRAHLYLSLSRHEGFGVPLVEAMAYGLPVLARPSRAVSYTLGDAACLLPDDGSPAQTGAMLHALAIDPQRRATQAAAQYASLDRFALSGQTAILEQALLRAGAAPRADDPLATGCPRPRDTLEANLRFAVTGHVNKTYSLAAVNRGLAVALEAAFPGRVRLIPVEEAVTADLSGVPAASRPAIAALVRRPSAPTAPELVISQHYPVYVPPRVPGQIRLAMLFWEESLLPLETIAKLEAGFDGVVAPTAFVARALQNSGLRLPVRVIDHAPPLAPFRALARAGTRPRGPCHEPGRPLTFLHVSSCFPRKGVDVLLRAWAASFTDADPVRLVIKSFPNPHNTIAADLGCLREARPDLAPVRLIDEDLDEAAMLELYARSDVMVLPSRGEGYNLPAAEALAAGLRLIVTGAGGHMDFCAADDPRVRLLAYRHAASASHLATAHSLWFEPDPDDLASALREALAAPAGAPVAARATALPDAGAATARRLAGFAIDLLLQPPHAPVRVAWVSSWSQKCGIAEYSRLLLDALDPDPEVSTTILCDDRTPAYTTLPGQLQHIPCWYSGEPQPARLLHAIARIDAHAVVVQHQPGLIGWVQLACLIDGVIAQGRVLTVTLHNTHDLLDRPAPQRAEVLAALARADRVIVHTLADLDRLTALGLGQVVTFFPHGVQTPLAANPPRELDPTVAPVLGCYGFFLPGKGIDMLIQAVILLRRKWPGLTLRLVNAAYGSLASDAELSRARQLAARIGGSVEFHTEFLPHERSLAILAECDLIVLPHRPSKEASSAALRTALAASVPVAVSRIALFDEAEEAIVRVDTDNADSLARDLDALLRDLPCRRSLQENAVNWTNARAWQPIARRFISMLVGLTRAYPRA